MKAKQTVKLGKSDLRKSKIYEVGKKLSTGYHKYICAH